MLLFGSGTTAECLVGEPTCQPISSNTTPNHPSSSAQAVWACRCASRTSHRIGAWRRSTLPMNAPFPKIKLPSGDYSYGIYLYGYPLMQAMAATLPYARGKFFVFVPVALLLTFMFAFLPWHLIEKRFLRLRRHFSQRSANIAAELHPELPIMRNWCGHLDHHCPADRFPLPRSLELGYE